MPASGERKPCGRGPTKTEPGSPGTGRQAPPGPERGAGTPRRSQALCKLPSSPQDPSHPDLHRINMCCEARAFPASFKRLPPESSLRMGGGWAGRGDLGVREEQRRPPLARDPPLGHTPSSPPSRPWLSCSLHPGHSGSPRTRSNITSSRRPALGPRAILPTSACSGDLLTPASSLCGRPPEVSCRARCVARTPQGLPGPSHRAQASWPVWLNSHREALRGSTSASLPTAHHEAPVQVRGEERGAEVWQPLTPQGPEAGAGSLSPARGPSKHSSGSSWPGGGLKTRESEVGGRGGEGRRPALRSADMWPFPSCALFPPPSEAWLQKASSDPEAQGWGAWSTTEKSPLGPGGGDRREEGRGGRRRMRAPCCLLEREGLAAGPFLNR